MAINDDPHAPYKVFEGEKLKGTYATELKLDGGSPTRGERGGPRRTI
jgi:hypothetical protein